MRILAKQVQSSGFAAWRYVWDRKASLQKSGIGHFESDTSNVRLKQNRRMEPASSSIFVTRPKTSS